jgi:hypothetical protein
MQRSNEASHIAHNDKSQSKSELDAIKTQRILVCMFGLTFPQLGARPNATIYEKLQNETSAQMCVWCDSTMETNMKYKALYFEYKFISISLPCKTSSNIKL